MASLRTIIVEVMGRNAGHLALSSGIAGGADIILIPELVPKIDRDLITDICIHIAKLRSQGRKFALIAIAEGVKNHAGERQKAMQSLMGETPKTDCIKKRSLIIYLYK